MDAASERSPSGSGEREIVLTPEYPFWTRVLYGAAALIFLVCAVVSLLWLRNIFGGILMALVAIYPLYELAVTFPRWSRISFDRDTLSLVSPLTTNVISWDDIAKIVLEPQRKTGRRNKVLERMTVHATIVEPAGETATPGGDASRRRKRSYSVFLAPYYQSEPVGWGAAFLELARAHKVAISPLHALLLTQVTGAPEDALEALLEKEEQTLGEDPDSRRPQPTPPPSRPPRSAPSSSPVGLATTDSKVLSVLTPLPTETTPLSLNDLWNTLDTQSLPGGWELEWVVATPLEVTDSASVGLPDGDPRVTLVPTPAGIPTAFGYNTLLAHARGSLIKLAPLTHSPTPNTLRRDVTTLQRHPNLAYTLSIAPNTLGGVSHPFDEDVFPIAQFDLCWALTSDSPPVDILERLNTSAPTLCATRRALTAANGFPLGTEQVEATLLALLNLQGNGQQRNEVGCQTTMPAPGMLDAHALNVVEQQFAKLRGAHGEE